MGQQDAAARLARRQQGIGATPAAATIDSSGTTPLFAAGANTNGIAFDGTIGVVGAAGGRNSQLVTNPGGVTLGVVTAGANNESSTARVRGYAPAGQGLDFVTTADTANGAFYSINFWGEPLTA